MIDLRYLNRFKGTPVSLYEMLNPDCNSGLREARQNGQITRQNTEESICILTGIRDSDLYHAQTFHYIPYLGSTSTAWEIRRLDDGSCLLSHEQTGDSDYRVLGPGRKEIGTLRGITFPYKTPYCEMLPELVRKNGEEYESAMEEMIKKMHEWRESLFIAH